MEGVSKPQPSMTKEDLIQKIKIMERMQSPDTLATWRVGNKTVNTLEGVKIPGVTEKEGESGRVPKSHDPLSFIARHKEPLTHREIEIISGCFLIRSQFASMRFSSPIGVLHYLEDNYMWENAYLSALKPPPLKTLDKLRLSSDQRKLRQEAKERYQQASKEKGQNRTLELKELTDDAESMERLTNFNQPRPLDDKERLQQVLPAFIEQELKSPYDQILCYQMLSEYASQYPDIIATFIEEGTGAWREHILQGFKSTLYMSNPELQNFQKSCQEYAKDKEALKEYIVSKKLVSAQHAPVLIDSFQQTLQKYCSSLTEPDQSTSQNTDQD